MTICREWMLHRQSTTHAEGKPLLCRSWTCEHCYELRKRQLMAIAFSGEPNRFLTLTVNPAFLGSPEERLRSLAWAWRTVVKRLRREHRGKTLEYLAVVESTKRGEPHLHILLRSPFLPHQQISDYMGELINAPVVDIRTARGKGQVIAYVLKYIAKDPAHFGTSKRYWMSRHYKQEDDYEENESAAELGPWMVFAHNARLMLAMWELSGYAITAQNDDHYFAEHTTRWRKNE